MEQRSIYTLRDAAGQALYVGCTYDLDTRLKNISREKPWWTEVADVDHFEVPEDRAAEAEHATIVQHQPRYNIKGRNGVKYSRPGLRHPRPQKPSPQIAPIVSLLIPREVAKRAGVTTQTVARWAREDKIPSVRTPGGQLRFRREDVDALLDPDGEAA